MKVQACLTKGCKSQGIRPQSMGNMFCAGKQDECHSRNHCLKAIMYVVVCKISPAFISVSVHWQPQHHLKAGCLGKAP